ncbi:hypothetical protein TKK_0002865 [Trichogramma kaykai]
MRFVIATVFVMIEVLHKGVLITNNYKCQLCVRFKNSDTSSKEMVAAEHEAHLAYKKLARKRTKTDVNLARSDSSIQVFHFDLQKILVTPKAKVSNLYYMSRLTVYNMSVYDFVSRTGSCNMWNETIGQRGLNEISSILMNCLTDALEAASIIKTIVLISDNCGGQNKNQYCFTMLYLTAMLYKVKIVHRFLEVGHTQSAGDSMHACIENYTKHKELYTQQ